LDPKKKISPPKKNKEPKISIFKRGVNENFFANKLTDGAIDVNTENTIQTKGSPETGRKSENVLMTTEGGAFEEIF
jgi:hypothetical protein